MHAVSAIAHGETLTQAEDGQTEAAKTRIAGVYDKAEIGVDAVPDAETSRSARDQMKSWGLDIGVHRFLRLPWPRRRPDAS